MNNDSTLSNTSSFSHASLWEEAAAILSGLIGGGLYGLKIRIPHSFGKRVSYRCSDLVQYYLIGIVILNELVSMRFSDDISIWESSIFAREN